MKAGKRFRKSIVVALIAAGALTYLLATTFAGSATSATMTTTYVTVAGGAFQPQSSSCFDFNHDGYSGAIQDFDECQYVAGVQLPQGAIVTGVSVFYDSNGNSGSDLHLEESDNLGNHNDIADFTNMPVCEIGPGACVASKIGSQLISPDVDNFHRSYAIWWDNDDCCDMVLFNVEIRLSVPSTTAAVSSSPAGPITTPSTNDG